MTEKEKMLRGDLYDASDPQLVEERRRARRLLKMLHDSLIDDSSREQIISKLLGSAGERVWIEPPFFCDYGSNIHPGDRVFFNFNCIVLDPARVEIGNEVLFGQNVQIYTTTHPFDHKTRRTRLELARPISIGSDVWIGGSAILGPGVRVGNRSVIGAGSVVTRDIPAGVFAAGNTCRVIRTLQ